MQPHTLGVRLEDEVLATNDVDAEMRVGRQSVDLEVGVGWSSGSVCRSHQLYEPVGGEPDDRRMGRADRRGDESSTPARLLRGGNGLAFETSQRPTYVGLVAPVEASRA